MPSEPTPQEQEHTEAMAVPDQSTAVPEVDEAMQREIDQALGDQSIEQLMQQVEQQDEAPEQPDADEQTPAGESNQDSPVGFELKRGRIERIHGDDVFVRLTAMDNKLQGLVPLKQFDRPPRQGSIMDFIVERIDEAEGLVHLSREGAMTITAWDQLTKGMNIEARVTGTNKGGLELELAGRIRAFMPASQVDLHHVDDMDGYVGQKLPCMVQEINVRAKRVILSRRRYLEHERERQRKKLLAELEPGQTRDGKVTRIMPYGAFVDLGGMDGLIHISDLSYAHIKDPKEVVAIGQDVQVKVLKIEEDGERVRLGLKQAAPDPWESVAANYAPGQQVTGKITRTADFGAFVELEPGIDGLLPISEMSWKRINKPSEVCRPGDTLSLQVLTVDAEKHRLSLSLKQIQGDPWHDAEQKYPKFALVEGSVVRTTEYGAFVELEKGVEGLAHISELADHRVNSVEDVVKVGDKHEFRVLAIDPQERKIGLSLKAVKTQPTPEQIEATAAEKKPTKSRKRAEDLKSGLGDHGGMGVGLGNLKL